jgi:hypothetical protein
LFFLFSSDFIIFVHNYVFSLFKNLFLSYLSPYGAFWFLHRFHRLYTGLVGLDGLDDLSLVLSDKVNGLALGPVVCLCAGIPELVDLGLRLQFACFPHHRQPGAISLQHACGRWHILLVLGQTFDGLLLLAFVEILGILALPV